MLGMLLPMSVGQVFFAVWAASFAALGFLMAVARTNPQEFHSNLSKWANWLGFRRLPTWLITKKADDVIFRGARVGLVLLSLFGAAVSLMLYIVQISPTRNLLMNIEFPEKGLLGGETTRVQMTFQNQTDDEYAVRRVFLVQIIRKDHAFSGGNGNFEALCKDNVLVPPEENDEAFKNKLMYHPSLDYEDISSMPVPVQVESEKRSSVPTSLLPHRTTTLEFAFKTKPIDLSENLTVYCPVVQMFLPDGSPQTVKCTGSSAGYVFLSDGRSDGKIFGGYFKTASLSPVQNFRDQCITFAR